MKHLTLLILSLFTLNAFAQDFTQTVRGQVIDKQSQIPMMGATVMINTVDPVMGAVTDDEGYFRLENVPVGRHTLIVSYLGYHNITMPNIDVTTGKEVYFELEMEEKVEEEEEIVIERKKDPKKPENEMIVGSNINLSPKETQRFAGSLQDPSRMVMSYAGVVAAGDNRNDVIIRGNSPIGVLWRLNGINIPNPNHFGTMGATGGPVSILNNNNLAKSDFLTGAFPSEYGNALAGAFDLKLRTGNNEKYEFTGQMGFNGAELGVEGPVSKNKHSSFMANYRYSTLGIFDAMGISFGVSAIPQYQDITFNIDIPTGLKYGRFQLFGLGGLSHIDLLDSERDPEELTYSDIGTDTYFKSNMGAIGLSHLYYINEKTHLKSVLAASGTSQAIDVQRLNDNNSRTKIYDNVSHEVKYSLSSYINTKFSARDNWRTGVNIDYYDVDYNIGWLTTNPDLWVTPYDFKGRSILGQAYSQWMHKFNDKFLTNVGVHYQMLDFNNSQRVEPRASVKYLMTKTQSVFASVGMHSQAQPFSVYLLETTVNNEQIRTNENLSFSKSNHFVIGYTKNISLNFRAKAEAYYQDVYDIPVTQNSFFSLSNMGADFGIPEVDSLVSNGTGRNYGVEVTLEKFFSKGYYFLINGSLYDSKYTGGDNIERNTAFNGNYAANALAGFEYSFNEKATIQFDAKITYAGGKRYVPIDLDASILAGTEVRDFSRAYEEQYPDYFRADAKLTFRLNSRKLNQSWALDIQNVLNTQNVFQEVYNTVGKDIRREYQIGIFPVMLYKIQF